MELRHLRYFVTVAEELNFSRAADRLHVAQPPLSHQILQLEQELGVQLFVRTKRPVSLTEAGKAFLEGARSILSDTEQMVRNTQRAAQGQIGQLSVGHILWADFYRFPEIIRIFTETHRDVRLDLHHLSTPEQVDRLLEGRLHVGFIGLPIDEPALVMEQIHRDPLVVVFSKGHRFESYREVPLQELAGEPFILFPRRSAPVLYDMIVNHCRSAGFMMRVKHEADHPPTVLGLVAAGAGISLVPASSQHAQRPGIDYRGLTSTPLQLEVLVAWRRDSDFTILGEFLKVVHQLPFIEAPLRNLKHFAATN